MLKKLTPWLALMALVLLPGMANAGNVLNPLDGNAWTLYVFGNGDAIFHIMNSIKLLMVPDGGSTGFNSLMMFLATVGFLMMAIQAGFDPGKSLIKMFMYIIMVAAVHMMTIEITANIRVYDPVSNYDNVVPGVPAMVGVPAALVSEVGHWFTKVIETYFTIPGEMTVTQGGFNLFGRLMTESGEFVISQPELKKSLSAYTADCVIPAMAQGRISVSELMTAPVMTTILAKASHKAILTKYFPAGTPNANGTGITYPTDITSYGLTYPVQGGLGAVLPCEGAWDNLTTDLTNHADALMAGTAQSWSKTGVMIPFETGMSVMMAMASSGGANPFANYSKPQGYILQQAMLNSQAGAFRSAAASIGNNEIMLSASIAQAEQSQKTSWFTAGRVFQNMMGYVYTTLQAFIFAIVPIVIISLMVPGLGKSIFTNYAQILVWLTLWQPMLAIVNYLITLFGISQLGSAMTIGNGVTMQNKWVMTENTSDLMLAAQFLGTSVPLLTWGLVKGSLAFTEFISHGIGSSMAQQAGASAATGNMSMGNMSMDNTSMNKFNTAMSSAVGAQTVMGYDGAMQTARDDGGATRAQFGAQMTNSTSSKMNAAQTTSAKHALSAQQSATESLSAMEKLSHGKGFDLTSGSGKQMADATLAKLSESASASEKAGQTQAAEKTRQASQALKDAVANSANVKVAAEARASAGLMVAGTGAQASLSVSTDAGKNATQTNDTTSGRGISSKDGNSLGNDNARGSSFGTDRTSGITTTDARGQQASTKSSHDYDVAMGQALQKAVTASAGAESSLQYGLDTGNTSQMNTRFDDTHENKLAAAKNDLDSNHAKHMADGAVAAGDGLVAAPTSGGFANAVGKVKSTAAASPAQAARSNRGADTSALAPSANARAIAAGGAALNDAFDARAKDSRGAVAATDTAVNETAKGIVAHTLTTPVMRNPSKLTIPTK